jgi:hypothetical protein
MNVQSFRRNHMLHELVEARQAELRAAETQIAHRMAWEQIMRVERLERALKAAKGRLQMLPALFSKAN